MGRRRRPAAMYKSANTNRIGFVGGLCLRFCTSRLVGVLCTPTIERPYLRASSVAPWLRVKDQWLPFEKTLSSAL